jgi:hypothetical protein
MVYQLASVCGIADYALERYMADEGPFGTIKQWMNQGAFPS